jgi:FixJ family two-component response regulator
MRRNSRLARNANKPRFSRLPLLFDRFQSTLHSWHRRLVTNPATVRTYPSTGARLRKEPVISIVDDDQFVRDSLKRLMKSFGYMATAHPTAGDFLNSPQLEETSCLIADVNMPGMTGVELYELLLKVGRSIPTILITAYPDDRVRTRAIDKGVLAYLVKPFSETDLTRYVRFALESDHPRK